MLVETEDTHDLSALLRGLGKNKGLLAHCCPKKLLKRCKKNGPQRFLDDNEVDVTSKPIKEGLPMLRSITLTLGISMALSLIETATAEAAPTSYPLTCRGGGGTLGLATTDNSASFYFTKSNGPAASGLEPGQCSWQDRAISATAEPTCLKQSVPGAVAWIFAAQAERSRSYVSSPTGTHWMRDLLEANKFVTFQVYNPGNATIGSCFVVTRIGF